MTYCLAARLDEGLRLSDTRTNRGIHNVIIHPKLDVFCPEDDRMHDRIDGESPFLHRPSTVWRGAALVAIDAHPEAEPGDIDVTASDWVDSR